MLGSWPKCGRNGCPLPAVFKVVMTDDHGEIIAFLCPICFVQAPKMLREIAQVREEQRRIENERID